MKLLVIGAGMMGSAAAYDMANSQDVESVTLADADLPRARAAAERANSLTHWKKVRAVALDAGNRKAAARLMRGHQGVLSAVPYFFNLGLCNAAIEAGCHFADLGGNNTVVRREYALGAKASKNNVAIAPDCGLSPGMASILAGELMRHAESAAGKSKKNGKVDALKIYVGGLPAKPQPPFFYQLVFSVEGLINEYVEPAKVLRRGKITEVEPLTEPEEFKIAGFDTMVAFHTSGGTSTLPETFAGRVGECFEKTLRYPSHLPMIRSLYDLGFFSSRKIKIGKHEISPREVTAKLFREKFSSDEPDVCIMRVEADRGDRKASFSLVDRYDRKTGMSAMMRTTAFPASIVLMMLARGTISKSGGIRQEIDVPADLFLREMKKRGIEIRFASSF